MKDFNLRFLNSADNESIPFLQFGVTTIEFAIKGKCKSGYIRPVNSTLIYPEKKEYVGFAENNEDFLVVWGGGEKEGQKVDKNSKNRMFIQLIHLRGNHSEAEIRLEHTAYGRKKKLRIYKPKTAPSMKKICKIVDEPNGSKLKTASSEGTYLPMYYSRWFPPKQIRYVKPPSYPRIKINYEEDDSGIESSVAIFSEVHGQSRKICTVEGDLRYSRLRSELFALFQNRSIFVLRLWFYWIHKRYREDTLSVSDGSSAYDGRSLEYDNLTKLEIPDIERFDFIIDAEENKVILYGTDIHYQEYWGKIKCPIVKAKIAGVADVLPVAAALWPLRLIQRAHYHNPIKAVKSSILKNLKGTRWMKMVPEKKRLTKSRVLALGDIRAHVPYIDLLWNRGGKDFISSDSRKGAKT